MISRDKDDKLIRIYFYICDKFEELQFYCERFSNNNKPEFTDQEIMTIYLYTMLDISVMLTPCFGDIDPPCSKWFKEQTA